MPSADTTVPLTTATPFLSPRVHHGWCSRCRKNHRAVMPLRVSQSGIVRSAGRCPDCGRKLHGTPGRYPLSWIPPQGLSDSAPAVVMRTTNTQTPCPPWCVEHYTADDGTSNHAGPADRAVCGQSATTGDCLTVAVWPELRVTVAGEAYAVGVVEKIKRDDVELSSCQLRELAAHLLAVAEQVDAANGGDTKCVTVSPLLSPVERQEDASDVASGGGQSAVTECVTDCAARCVTNTTTNTTTRRTEQTVCAATTAPNLTHEVTQ